jgi:hypothetical protein
MPIGELIKLKPQALQVLVRQADDDLRCAKMVKDWLHGILSQKYEDQASALRQQTGKDTGIVRLDDNGITVLYELPKKVEWDQEKLSRIVEKLTSEGWQRQQLAKLEFKVSERTFNELPSGVRAQFEEARTISYGKPSYKFAVDETEGAE